MPTTNSLSACFAGKTSRDSLPQLPELNQKIADYLSGFGSVEPDLNNRRRPPKVKEYPVA